MIGVPYTPAGPDLDAFARAAAAHRPRLYVTNAAPHNPTGAGLAAATAHKLLKLAEAHGGAVTVVRDPREAVAGAHAVYTDVWLSMGDPDEERARLEDFRSTLLRLAVDDEELQPASGDARALVGPWVESWKMNRAIYERYGGVVALTALGPTPHGARAALIADYERRGLLEFADAALRERVYAMLRQPPSVVVPPDRVDFTPYWKRPIPPSYFPD